MSGHNRVHTRCQNFKNVYYTAYLSAGFCHVKCPCCGSGSVCFLGLQWIWIRIFYRQAKIVRKTLFPTVLWLLSDFLSVNKLLLETKISNPELKLCDFLYMAPTYFYLIKCLETKAAAPGPFYSARISQLAFDDFLYELFCGFWFFAEIFPRFL
jgi:hypothetical protein